MNTNKLDVTKPVQTRDGRKARIICSDRDADRSIVALIGGAELPMTFFSDGHFIADGLTADSDLVNVPEIRHEFQNVWKRSTATYVTRYKSLEAALIVGMRSDRAGVIKFTFTDDKLTNVELVSVSDGAYIPNDS